jgi:cell division protease FtsH
MDPKQQRLLVGYLLVATVMLILMRSFVSGPHTQNVSYGEFRELVRAAKVDQVTLGERTITGLVAASGLDKILSPERLDEMERAGGEQHRFVTVRIEAPELVSQLEAANVDFSGQLANPWTGVLLSWFLPILCFVAIWIVLLRRLASQHQGGLMSIGKSKAGGNGASSAAKPNVWRGTRTVRCSRSELRLSPTQRAR